MDGALGGQQRAQVGTRARRGDQGHLRAQQGGAHAAAAQALRGPDVRGPTVRVRRAAGGVARAGGR
eukprot:5093197-Pleurochrysis_carterae.AAC.1